MYEQALEEDVAQRIYANLANISMDEIRGKDYDDIAPAIMEQMIKAAEEFQDKLLVLDMVGEDAGTGGVPELTAQLAEEKRDTGWVADLVILDWLGEMAERYDNRPEGESWYRRLCESFMTEFI